MIKLAVNERRCLLKQPIDLVYKIYEHFSLTSWLSLLAIIALDWRQVCRQFNNNTYNKMPVLSDRAFCRQDGGAKMSHEIRKL